MEVKEGEILAGKYRIERVLGRGGMGVVVAATHLQLERRVALKFLLPEAVDNRETLARFAREARAAARLRSEHVARVIDVGTLESGAPYMVMEYLDGTDLSSHMAAHGPLGTAEAAELMLQACEALAEAHAAGIVHRDLKPANLFLARYPDGSPCLKILDFGISKVSATTGDDFDMTRTAAVMGTPYYMSPEQMRSTRAVDARSDIWSLGVILYELVSGRVPFHAVTLPQLCAMVLGEPPTPLRELCRDVPASFEALVLRCLEKDPNLRFQAVAELAATLFPLAPNHHGRSVDAIARISASSKEAVSTLQAPSAAIGAVAERTMDAGWGRTSSGRHHPRRVWAVCAALALALAAIGGGSLLWARRTMPIARSPGATSTDIVRAPVVAPSAEAPLLKPPAAPASGSAPPPSTLTPPLPTTPAARPGPARPPKRSAPVTPSPAVTSLPPAPPPSRPAANPLDGRL